MMTGWFRRVRQTRSSVSDRQSARSQQRRAACAAYRTLGGIQLAAQLMLWITLYAYDRIAQTCWQAALALALPLVKEGVAATEEDWGAEYLDYILSVKTVDSVDEAIAHINRYNTGHSEAIVTENQEHAEKFLREIDAAAVYVNASTRFTDGFEFGFGAEIGISTQKLHARGPMGLEALTSYKYEITGNGQTRG